MTKHNIKGIVLSCILAIVIPAVFVGTAVLEMGTVYGALDTKVTALEKADEKFVIKEVFELTVKNMGDNIKTISEDIKTIKEDIKIIAEKKK